MQTRLTMNFQHTYFFWINAHQIDSCNLNYMILGNLIKTYYD